MNQTITIKSNEEKRFNFSLLIEGAKGNPKASFILNSTNGIGLIFPCDISNNIASVTFPKLDELFINVPNNYSASLIVKLDGEEYIPWKGNIEIEKKVSIQAIVNDVKESKVSLKEEIQEIKRKKIKSIKELFITT